MGRITIDDVVDVIKEEAERITSLSPVLLRMCSLRTMFSCAQGPSALADHRINRRHTGLTGYQYTRGRFENITRNGLVFSLIGAMGGNAGVQSSSIVVQGIAAGTIDLQELQVRLSKSFLWH
jgi:magnesium transporter